MRKNTLTLKADSLGEGLEVEVKRVTYGERRAIIERLQGSKDDTERELRTILAEIIIGWNFGVDVPRTPEAYDDLYPDELEWLYKIVTRIIQGRLGIGDDDIKN